MPNAPGSSVDTLSRIMANKLPEVLGQQVVIDNRAGAGGIIGMEIAKQATPDGYTLIAATTAASTIAVPAAEEARRSIRSRTTTTSCSSRRRRTCWWCNPNAPPKSVKELIDLRQGQGRAGQHGFGRRRLAKPSVGRVLHAGGELPGAARALQRRRRVGRVGDRRRIAMDAHAGARGHERT